MMTLVRAAWFALAAVVIVLAASSGCADKPSSGFDPAAAPSAEGGSPDDAAVGVLGNGGSSVTSITVDPPTATIEIKNGIVVTQAFKVLAHFDDGTTSTAKAGVAWSVTNLQVGAIDGAGVYTPSGAQGGTVKINAAYESQKASATLTVKIHVVENPANAPAPVQAALLGATASDGTVVWAYPYDGTVFPRGLAGPPLMWNNGLAADVYYVHIVSATFELESFTAAPPPARYSFSAGTWQKLVDSTSGAVTLHVARVSNGAATVLVNHSWTVAPASVRGTIYYWGNAVGRVMRIKPGAAAPDDFSAGTFGTLPASGCTMTCHTVSADGSTLVSGGDTLGGSYNLLTNKPIYDLGGTSAADIVKRAWALPAVSPNGKYLIQNASALPVGGWPPPKDDGISKTADGTKMTATGLEGARLGMPNFAPDGSKIAFVGVGATTPGCTTVGSLCAYDFNLATVKAGAAAVELVPQGAGAAIAWPSVTPDAKWIIYQRGPLDTRNGNADLFLASTTTPNKETRLAKLDGDTYPFAAGARDLSWNYEPTFAPVASGGYFWVVFTSRRTYGNLLLGAKDAVKQLWVAAIDLNPTPGQDPSHPPFLLPGQDQSLNMRGFWALDPCKGDGQGCASGTECCGGFCDSKASDGGLACGGGATCSLEGDRCNVTADCCNASTGTTCINRVCADPAPK